MTGTDSTLKMGLGILMSKRKTKPKDRVEMLPFATLVLESESGKKREIQVPVFIKREEKLVKVTLKRKKKR